MHGIGTPYGEAYSIGNVLWFGGAQLLYGRLWLCLLGRYQWRSHIAIVL
jgi:hypothetical protein